MARRLTGAEELKQRLRWIITLRWAAVLVSLAAAQVAKTLGMFSFSLTPIYAILGFTAFYNMVCTLRVRAAGADLRKLAVAQIALDQVALALGVYFSGGCDSPFIYLVLGTILWIDAAESPLERSFRHGSSRNTVLCWSYHVEKTGFPIEALGNDLLGLVIFIAFIHTLLP